MPEIISKKDLVAQLHTLPSLPVALQDVIASFSDPDLDGVVLAKKIEQDQGLSARILRVANSSFYGLPRKVGSIQDALVVLGFDAVRLMALSAGMRHNFPDSSGSLFDRQAYWQRSFRVAVISKALAKGLRAGEPLVFIAGMFYDIGQLVMDLCIPQQFSGLLQQQAASGVSLIEIEQSTLGFDHLEAGAELISLWNFPPEIERVVRYWPQPELHTDSLINIVHLAVLLEEGISGADLMARLPGAWCEAMSVSWERIETCMPDVDQLEAAAGLAG